ncbi:MAG TPA: KpsF/GutQ family sugar-phosphate isomerase [Bacteroidales bacterium]|nr:KpsF/GutQ family sugar-phosphate isomerase [Bacteroidales bacterium]
MKDFNELKEIAKATIRQEAESILGLLESIDTDFARCVDLISRSAGRVIVTGIGKSAIIAQKIVATLNSTGTPATFMHAADAIHGDLGTIRKEDIILCLSKSGETPEIKVLVPLLKLHGSVLIAIVGNRSSFLARQADFILDTTVQKEACPNNLAPTSSTTAQLVMGDALAVCLLEQRGFSIDDFARFHPGGSLGKQLYLRVSDLYVNNLAPSVNLTDDIKTVILEISGKRLGATAVLDGQQIAGIITDGDLRRMLQNETDIKNTKASDIMNKNPKTIDPGTLVVDALNIMRQNNITQLLIAENGKYLGVIHLHDILREGII